MTVKELIERLGRFPQHADVGIFLTEELGHDDGEYASYPAYLDDATLEEGEGTPVVLLEARTEELLTEPYQLDCKEILGGIDAINAAYESGDISDPKDEHAWMQAYYRKMGQVRQPTKRAEEWIDDDDTKPNLCPKCASGLSPTSPTPRETAP